VDCARVRDRLSEYLDGVLPIEDAAGVREHLARCPHCLEVHASMSRLVEQMGHMEQVSEPAGFLERVNARLDRASPLRRIGHWLFVPVKAKLPLDLGVAAVAAVLIFLFVGRDGHGDLYDVTLALNQSTAATLVPARGQARVEPGEKRGKGAPATLGEAIRSVAGRVLETEYLAGTELPERVTVELRAGAYRAFLQELGLLGELRSPPGEVPTEGKESVRVRITLRHPGP
jgi:anti-sigma factor RsiW